MLHPESFTDYCPAQLTFSNLYGVACYILSTLYFFAYGVQLIFHFYVRGGFCMMNNVVLADITWCMTFFYDLLGREKLMF